MWWGYKKGHIMNKRKCTFWQAPNAHSNQPAHIGSLVSFCLFLLRFYSPVNPMGSWRAWTGENDLRKYFMTNLHERMLPTPQPPDHQLNAHPTEACCKPSDKQTSKLSDKSCLLAWRNFASLVIQNVPSEDSDQTVQTCGQIWIFNGCTCPKVHSLGMANM